MERAGLRLGDEQSSAWGGIAQSHGDQGIHAEQPPRWWEEAKQPPGENSPEHATPHSPRGGQSNAREPEPPPAGTTQISKSPASLVNTIDFPSGAQAAYRSWAEAVNGPANPGVDTSFVPASKSRALAPGSTACTKTCRCKSSSHLSQYRTGKPS